MKIYNTLKSEITLERYPPNYSYINYIKGIVNT